MYVPDKNAIVWTIKQFYGSREYRMRAHFGLPTGMRSIGDEDDNDSSWKKPIGTTCAL